MTRATSNPGLEVGTGEGPNPKTAIWSPGWASKQKGTAQAGCPGDELSAERAGLGVGGGAQRREGGACRGGGAQCRGGGARSPRPSRGLTQNSLELETAQSSAPAKDRSPSVNLHLKKLENAKQVEETAGKGGR